MSRVSHLWMSTDAVGGVWQFSLDLARGLKARGVHVTLAVLGPAPASEQWAEAEAAGLDVELTGLPLDWTTEDERRLERAAAALAEHVARLRPDAIQINHPSYADGPWTAPLLAVVHSCHGSWWAAMRTGPPPPDFAWRIRRMRRALLRSDRVATPTAALAGSVQEVYGLPCPPGVVHNGRAPAAKHGEAPPAPFVFAAGRLWDEAKGMAALDRAAARIEAPVLAAGPLQGPNGEQAAFDHLRPCGVVAAAEMAAHHRAAAAFVSLARYEPFGLAVLEAAQAATPLVLADIPTFRELWDGAALFVQPEPGAVAACCNRLLADPAAAADWGARAAARASRYGVDAMVDSYLAEYAILAGESRSRMAG